MANLCKNPNIIHINNTRCSLTIKNPAALDSTAGHSFTMACNFSFTVLYGTRSESNP